MTDRDRTAAENVPLRAGISALSAASVRISASLDLETVLKLLTFDAPLGRFAAVSDRF